MAKAKAAPKKKGKAKAEEVEELPKTKNDLFEKELEGLGLADALQLAENLIGMDVECMTTGFPDLDAAINEQLAAQGKSGMPRARHVEVFSKKESSGKTSLLLKIAAVLQSLGFRVGIADIEQTITTAYMTLNGLKTTAAECGDNLYPVRLLRSHFSFNDDEPEKIDLYCDDVLGIVKKAMNVFDFLIIDSIDALASKDDALKEVEDNRQVGGISKKLSAFFRENKNYRACCAWCNQTRMAVGAYNPSGGTTYVTSGGKALPFYATMRWELSDIKTLKEGGDDGKPYGFICRVKIIKNKIGDKGRFVDLYYINGEGMSTTYSYFNQAIALGILSVQKGGWHYILGEGKNIEEKKKNASFKGQGELATYRLLTGDSAYGQAAWQYIVNLIDGEDVEVGVEEVDEAAAAESEDLASEEQVESALPTAA
jgi:recombination protein RecA